MTLKCEIYLQTSQATLAVRTRTTVQDLPSVLKQTYEKIIQYLREKDEQPAGPPFAAFHNRDGANLDIEAGFPVFTAMPGSDPIEAGQLPAGKVASCLFTGPYSAMEPAYGELKQWIMDNGYEPTGICYEIYMNDPAYTPPTALKTQIILPLKGEIGQNLE
jgi:effector-binding domain-containing protein